MSDEQVCRDCGSDNILNGWCFECGGVPISRKAYESKPALAAVKNSKDDDPEWLPD